MSAICQSILLTKLLSAISVLYHFPKSFSLASSFISSDEKSNNEWSVDAETKTLEFGAKQNLKYLIYVIFGQLKILKKEAMLLGKAMTSHAVFEYTPFFYKQFLNNLPG